jgi:hypothetical protein
MPNKDTVKKRDKETARKARAQDKRARKLERRAAKDIPEPGTTESALAVVDSRRPQRLTT